LHDREGVEILLVREDSLASREEILMRIQFLKDEMREMKVGLQVTVILMVGGEGLLRVMELIQKVVSHSFCS